jgi:Ser/Thr protein kinase RdoA (MazF antagonist)
MDKERVKPDWPAIGLDEVRVLLSQFSECGEPTKTLSVSPRPFSAASVVATNERRVFIKRHHHSVRNREGLMEEHRFLAHLLEHGAPVTQVFSTVLGESAIEMGEWTYEVHDASSGVDIYEEALSWTPFRSAAHAYSAGKSLARLHLAAQGFAAPQRRLRPLVASFTIFAAEDPDAGLAQYLSARPVLEDYLVRHSEGDQALELLAPFHSELLPLLPSLPSLWTHNDLHASNLLWSDESDDAQVSTIIDFGLADRTNAVHDLAQAIERNAVEWLELEKYSTFTEYVPVHLDHIFALLDGYESERPLTNEEVAALAPMIAICHAEFALTEADYFLDVLHSKANVRLCTEGYLVGHARWFRGPAGTRLLNAIRRWAETRTTHLQKFSSDRYGEI